MKRASAAVVAAWLLVAQLIAQGRLADLPRHLQPLVDSGAISGAVLLVADREHIVHLSAVGRSSLETGESMRVDHIFAIASMTKPVTAVAVGLLVDEGKLSFDDPVEKHLAEFRDLWVAVEETRDPPRRVLVPAPRPITIRDLLTHTSGMRDISTSDPHWTLSERVKILSRTPLRFAPGAQWSYCSSSFDVLGRIVEVAAGLPFERFVRERILDPLGMRDTGFHLTAEQKARLAAAYRFDPATGRLQPFARPPSWGDPTDPTTAPRPGGGLYSTAPDMAAFYQMLLNGRGAADGCILSPGTIAEMLRPQTSGLPGSWPGFAWGLGLSLLQDPLKVDVMRHYTAGSFGHGGAAGTMSFADPGRGVICILMIHVVGMPDPLRSPARQAFERGIAETRVDS